MLPAHIAARSAAGGRIALQAGPESRISKLLSRISKLLSRISNPISRIIRDFMHLVKEPLFQFLVLGVLILAVYQFSAGRRQATEREILVTQTQIDGLVDAFARTWQRPPTKSERDGLIQDHLREEALYREGIAMGLDRNDPVVRRRLRQKLEFVADSIVAQSAPTDADLQTHLNGNADAFRVEPRFSFSHVFLNPDRHGNALEREAGRLLDQLKAGSADPATTGDRILLDPDYSHATPDEIEKLFGRRFADSLSDLTVGEWVGPVPSGYGVHLVRVEASTPGRVPELGEVRDAVARDWAYTSRRDARERFYQAVLRRYEVTIEGSELSTAGTAAP
jgi:hypothetical protein